MKKSTAAVLLLCSVVCLLAARLLPAPAQPVKPEKGPVSAVITDISVGQVNGLVIRRQDEKQGILHMGGVFSVVDHESEPFDESKLAAMLYAACHLSADRIIASPESLAVYGLESPACQVSLLLTDGTYARFSLGDVNPVSGQRYVLSDDGCVCLISGATADLFFQKTDDLRSMRLFGDWTVEELARPERILISNETGVYALALIEDSVSGLYAMVSPVTAALDWQVMSSSILQVLPKLHPEHFVTDDADLAAYGLDKPSLVLGLSLGGDIRTALFSPAEDGMWYACADGSREVYLISDSLLSGLHASYTDLLGSSMYHRSLGEIASVSLCAGSQRKEYSFFHQGESILCRTNDRTLDAADTAFLYKQLSQIPVAGELNDEYDLSASSLLTLTFTLNSGDMDILEFIPISDRYCAVSINGKIQLATFRSVVDPILRLTGQ